MCSTDSDSSNGSESPLYSDEFCGAIEVEDDINEGATTANTVPPRVLQDNSSDEGPYRDEPLADEAFITKYNIEIQRKRETDEKLGRRFEGTESLSTWCSCDRCSTEHLTNVSEYRCCKEMESCLKSLTSEKVLQDVKEGQVLICITEHPGFAIVCLEKWSLRSAADKYSLKKSKTRYRQTASEEQFLRSIAYREFTRLVHGFLGNRKRIPLPACAYHAIRHAFPSPAVDFTGFIEEDDSE